MSTPKRLDPLSQDGTTLDRRTFIGAVAAVSAASFVPGGAQALGAFGPSMPLLADWTIDDMWGVHPRYADPIAYGRPATDVDVAVDPIDAQLVC